MKRVATFAVLAALSTSAQTESDRARLEDFAYAMPIETGPGKAPFYTLTLPEIVYHTVTRPDRGDIRVFDADGRVVPHMLQSLPAPKRPASWSRLPVFPLPAGKTGATPANDVHVRVDERGAVIDVIAADAAPVGSHYLLDASAVAAPIEALRLDWGEGHRRMLARARVECSEDLDRWREVAIGSLAELREGDARLYQNVIALPGTRCRYLRLAWPSSEARIAGVEARLAPPEAEAAPSPPVQWRDLEPVRQSDGGYEFDAGGFFPVTRVNVNWPGESTVARLRVEARTDAAAAWRPVHTGLFFALEIDGGPLSGEAAAVRVTLARHWRIRVAEHGDPSIPAAPRLLLGWQPDRLLFVASGAPPYRLAYGNAAAPPGSNIAASLYERLQRPGGSDEAGQAVAGVPRAVAGDAALVPRSPPLPWQRILLWAVLVLGVLLLGRMALGLYREMMRHG
ncbi:MAG: hypothetical protein NFCOHLIN_01379 [Gammaproteobacteria bacterium]|nr:hypothetical protein [Gammaproteobacteria bacterium]